MNKRKLIWIAAFLLLGVGVFRMFEFQRTQPASFDHVKLPEFSPTPFTRIFEIFTDRDADEIYRHGKESSDRITDRLNLPSPISDTSDEPGKRTVYGQRGTLLFHIRSSEVFDETEPTEEHRASLRRAIERVMKARKESGAMIVFDADPVPFGSSGLLVGTSDRIDLTETVREEYRRMWSERGKGLRQNEPVGASEP